MHELSIAIELVDLVTAALDDAASRTPAVRGGTALTSDPRGAAAAANAPAARDRGGPKRSRVEAVHVRLGALSGVAEEALRFSFEVAGRGTAVDGARLVVEHGPIVIACGPCHAERVLDDPCSFRCPVCGAAAGGLVRGREVELTALEVEEHAAAHR